MAQPKSRIIVIGAGIGGLAAALRLASAGQHVTVLERHSQPGGKMRTLSSDAGPVDAGPTVMTMRSVFEDLFDTAGEKLSDHLTLLPQAVLARHCWSDGSTLDLHDDATRNKNAVTKFAGARDAAAFAAFTDKARKLFTAFERPMMYAAKPNQLALTAQVMANPSLLLAMAPLSTLAKSLSRQFEDPRLRQLFGRYATYVGGSPYQAPTLLSLIWQAEASGVWCVQGGMHKLAEKLAALIMAKGGKVQLNMHVAKLHIDNGQIHGVILADGTHMSADQVLFNGDPRALQLGLMGDDVQNTIPKTATEGRSLSAYVWSFAAKADGVPLAHHNVFFADKPETEFGDLRNGQMPSDATLYVCAQDRKDGNRPTDKPERFEIIMNAPPALNGAPKQEFETCQTRTFQRLAHMGLRFDRLPGSPALTTPAMFDQLFPGSAGSLYGRSPHGLTAALKRPLARTQIKGLYLAGGGVHPGAGIPMAALSGKHAAEAILKDLISTSTSRQTATHGGTSTASRMTATAQSRSSAS